MALYKKTIFNQLIMKIVENVLVKPKEKALSMLPLARCGEVRYTARRDTLL